MSLNARLRPGVGGDAGSQQFTVFVIETSDTDAARSLDTWSRGNADASHAALSVAPERLFVLVVARSFVQRVSGYETAAGLERFRTSLSDALKTAVEGS